MTVPILVEPAAGGYRARTGGPLDLSADAATAPAAVAALQAMIDQRLQAGGVPLAPPADGPRPPAYAPPFGDDPLWDQFLAAVEEYRRQQDLEPGGPDPAAPPAG